jgi:hypothetical protein
MKKLVILSLLLIAIASNSFAQQVKLNKDTTTSLTTPLYIFKLYADDKEYNALPLLALMGPETIFSMDVLTDKKANELYGSRGKYGVIIITLAKGIEVHEFDQLLNKYKIKPRFRKLPITINYALIRTTKYRYYTSTTTNIKSVSVEKEKETGMKYISIITTDYNPNPAPDNQFRIRGASTSGM